MANTRNFRKSRIQDNPRAGAGTRHGSGMASFTAILILLVAVGSFGVAHWVHGHGHDDVHAAEHHGTHVEHVDHVDHVDAVHTDSGLEHVAHEGVEQPRGAGGSMAAEHVDADHDADHDEDHVDHSDHSDHVDHVDHSDHTGDDRHAAHCEAADPAGACDHHSHIDPNADTGHTVHDERSEHHADELHVGDSHEQPEDHVAGHVDEHGGSEPR